MRSCAYCDHPDVLHDANGECQVSACSCLPPTDDLEFLLDTVIWMSGSEDFAPGGKAGEEWARRRERVDEIMAVHSEDPEPTGIGFGYVGGPADVQSDGE